MKVAIDAFRLLDEPQTSGANYVAELAAALAPLLDVDSVRLLVPRAPDSTFRYQKLLDVPGVIFVWPQTASYPAASYRATLSWIQRAIPRLMRRVGADCDWFVAPYHQAPVGLNRSTKVLTVIHDVCGLYPSAGYYWHKKGPYLHLINFLTALWRSDALVYISDHTASRFGGLFPGARSKASRVILNRVSPGTLTPGQVSSTLAALELQAGHYFLAFAAPHRRKGLDLVLSGFRFYLRSGDVGRLALIAAPGFVARLAAMVGSYGVANSVTIASGVTDSQRDALYSGATALVFPSRCEGFGYPILEAMARGCPPIAWERSPAREVVGAAVPLLDRLDPQEIGLYLRRYAEMAVDQRAQLREMLRERAAELNGNDFGREFVALMKSVV